MEEPMYGRAIGAKPDAAVPKPPKGSDAVTLLRNGWQEFYAQNPVAAMKLFNEAWALQPDSDEVYYAFGFILSVRGNLDGAMDFYKEALNLNPSHTMSLVNLGRCYKEKAYAVYLNKHLEKADDEVKKALAPAFDYYKKAEASGDAQSPARLTTRESDMSYLYYQWAIALELEGEYAQSWDMIKKSRKYGGERIIETDFISELSKHMQEPVSY